MTTARSKLKKEGLGSSWWLSVERVVHSSCVEREWWFLVSNTVYLFQGFLPNSIGSQNHRNVSEMNLYRSQNPTQRGKITSTRSGLPQFCLAKSWKPLRMETPSPIPVLLYLPSQKVFLMSNLSSCTLCCCLILCHYCKELSSLTFATTIQVFIGCCQTIP